MKRLGLGILLLAALACDPGGPTELEGTTVRLTLTNPLGIERPELLRLAVVWRTGQTSGTPWLTTFDQALSDTEASHSFRVELPKGANLDELPDPVTIVVKCDEWKDEQRTWSGARPLWVVYADLNRNQRLDGLVSDRVWGVTDFSRNHLAAFVDFEQALSQLSLEETECFRQATGGGFSPFVSGSGSQYVYSTPVLTSEFTMMLNPSDFPGALLACGSSYSRAQTPVQEPTLLAVASDLEVDGCTNETSCTRVRYEGDWLGATQGIYAPGFYRSSLCVRSGKLEVLWIREDRSECKGCTCVSHVKDRGWVVSRDATPLDWPCGESVETCATAAAQVEVIPTECLVQ